MNWPTRTCETLVILFLAYVVAWAYGFRWVRFWHSCIMPLVRRTVTKGEAKKK